MRKYNHPIYIIMGKAYILFIIALLIAFIHVNGDIAANGIEQAQTKGFENIYEAIEESEFMDNEMKQMLIAISPENNQTLQQNTQ